IDVEDRSRPETQWRDALIFLPDGERSYIEAATGNERRDRFFRLWTLREAFAKASGLGMAKAFEEVAFTLDPPGISNAAHKVMTDWRFCVTADREGVLATACRHDARVVVERVERI